MIDWSCPADLEPYAAAHNYEIKEKDMLAYAFGGQYILSAVAVAIEHNLAGRKAKSEYTKELVFKDFGMTEEEKRQQALEKFVQQMKLMEKTFKEKHKADKEAK